MVRQFYQISLGTFLIVVGISFYWPAFAWSLIVLLPLFAVGVADTLQVRQGVRRNFPVIGNLRYFFEFIRPELQQYFVESNLSGRPVAREHRSVIYQRAKGQTQTLPFGTQRDVYEPNHEWIEHSIVPVHADETDLFIHVGGDQCVKPYKASVFNISAMSYGALSPNAIMALNRGAKKGGFFHNTGEGGISPYHLQGGNIVWQIGTGYFGCRNKDGTFSEEAFKERATHENVKMIEIKLSQGAKPGKGGILPAAKVTEEIAKIRLVEMGKDVVSPAAHTAFSTPIEMLHFIKKLRELCGGKPVGFKLCVGIRSEFVAICKAMLKTGILPDFITVDGAEGGTGAAPLEFSNSVGVPLEEGLTFVHDMLVGYGLRKKIRIIASGKVFTSFHMLTKLALGADMVNSARGMMMALGCIQALKCNTNHCPVGVATTDPKLARGLYVPDKAERVAKFHKETVHAFSEVLGAMGHRHPSEIRRREVFRRLTDGKVTTYEEMFPSLREGSLLNSANLPLLRDEYLRAIKNSVAESFSARAESDEAPLRALN